MATDTHHKGICHCSNPNCPSCKGTCSAPGTKAVSVKWQGERMGDFRFCGDCEEGWAGLPDMDVKPLMPRLAAR